LVTGDARSRDDLSRIEGWVIALGYFSGVEVYSCGVTQGGSMRAASWLLTSALAMAPIASAQTQVPLPDTPASVPVHVSQSMPSQLSGEMQDVSRVTFAVTFNLLNRKLVEDLPFAATGAVVVEQTLADGSAVKNSYDVAVWRDAEGRLRVEYALKLPGLVGPHNMVQVWDPKSGTNMTWSDGSPEVHVVMVHHMPVAGSNGLPGVMGSLMTSGTQVNGGYRQVGNGPGSSGNAGGGVYQVGGRISAPVAVSLPEAEFSNEARRAKYEGVCIVALIVDAQGNPQNIHVVRSLGMGLDEKAMEAVRKYKFKPAMKDGATPVPVMITVEVSFRLNPGARPAQAPMPLPRNAALPSAGSFGSQNSKTEELPAGSIAGLYVTGVRTTTTIPAGTAGNERDITVTSETWTSPDLKITVRQITDDPRSGKVTTELTDITRTDPDPALFQAPEGYAVRDMSLPLPAAPSH
jgi:TonB family protein